MTLNTVLENSLKEIGIASGSLEDLRESTTSDSIALFASNVGALIKEKFKTSLAYEICDVQQLKTSIGNIYILTKEEQSAGKWKFVVKKSQVSSTTSKANTGFTQETWQDINAIYGEDANEICANILAKVSADEETSDVLALIAANSKDMNPLDAVDYEHVFTKVGEAISKINQKTFRTMEAFVIVPAAFAGNVITDPNYFISDSLETNSMFLQYKFGKTKYYVNPNTSDTNVYIGVNGKEPGTSSIIFSPYQYTVQEAIDSDSGVNNIYVFNRYAVSLNPLHTVGNEMLYKFALTMPNEL